MSDNTQDFESLFEEPPEFKTAVGTREQELREFLGNDRYEKMLAYNDAEAQSVLMNNVAVANKFQAQANLYNSIAGILGRFIK